MLKSTGAEMAGKNALVFGVANESSIAFHIAKALEKEGVNLCFCYYPRVKEWALPAMGKFKKGFAVECDAISEESLKEAFSEVKKKWERVDYIVHSIAFAHKKDLEGKFIDTSQDRFNLAMDTSAYSLLGITRQFLPLMGKGSSIVTMTFFGGEMVTPSYKVMGPCKAALDAIMKYLAFELGSKGIRVNAVSAGPVETVAAFGITNFKKLLKSWIERSPLRKSIDKEDIGNAAVFLLSNKAKSITGEILHVDTGTNIIFEHPRKQGLFG